MFTKKIFVASMLIGFAAAIPGCVAPSDDLDLDEVSGADAESAPLVVGDPYVASTTTGKSQNGTVSISIPSGTASGNLLLLILHRTDDLNFWGGPTQLADRMTPDDVDDWNGPVAKCSFDNSAGDFDCAGTDKNDLNQVVYWKKATAADVGGKVTTIDFPGSHPAWAIMARIPNGGSNSNPVRAWLGQTSCDNIRGTRFPSVNGNSGDLLLLSSSFDDGASSSVTSSNFTAPSGFARNAVVIDNDEAGYLYSRALTATGGTGTPASVGPESATNVAACKDIAVSMVIRKTGT
ncbi:MAG: hypothetical protein ABI134_07535 [Byssovorax sp.]